MRKVKTWLWKVISIFLPAAQLWRANRIIDHSKSISEYEQGLEQYLDEYDGDLQKLVQTAEEAHRSEIERNSHLDSKAGNYLGNIGVVLSILSLGPILSIVLGIQQKQVVTEVWPAGLVLLLFGITVVSLLCSTYYSSKALRMRGYKVYFTADGIKERINKGDPGQKERAKQLLVCQKNNELHNLDKNNLISVAEEFSRNGLISLGLGVGIIILILIPANPIQLIIQAVCSIF